MWSTHHAVCLMYKHVESVLWCGVAAVGQVKVQQQYEVSWLNDDTEWPDYFINGCFLPWWHGDINTTQDGNKSGDVAEAYGDNATENVIYTQD